MALTLGTVCTPAYKLRLSAQLPRVWYKITKKRKEREKDRKKEWDKWFGVAKMIMGGNPITLQNKASPHPFLIPSLMIGECSSYQPVSKVMGVEIKAVCLVHTRPIIHCSRTKYGEWIWNDSHAVCSEGEVSLGETEVIYIEHLTYDGGEPLAHPFLTPRSLQDKKT